MESIERSEMHRAAHQNLRLFWLVPLLLCFLLWSGFAKQASAAPHFEINGGATINCPGGVVAADIGGTGVVSATIGDFVWLDANSNGIHESNESGVGNVEVTATCSGSDVSATATTDQRGNYFFVVENPAAAPIVLTFTPPPGYALTLQGQGNDRANDSDPDPRTGQTGQIALSAGSTNTEQDAGLVHTVRPPAVCGTIYNDLQGTGQIDKATPKLAGFQVVALPAGSNNPIGMATSMVDGRYCIALPESAQPAQYNIQQLPVDGWSTTSPPGDIPTHQVTVAPNTIVGNIDFANYNPITKLCGYKYHDINGNGLPDPGEPPLAGWTFNVTNGSGAIVGSATTGDNGRFCIEVAPGSYTVSEVAQTGWTQTQPSSGTYSVSVNQGTQLQKLIFGNTKVTSKICGIKFNDIDGDGIQDPGEAGLPGWTIEVQLPGGSTVSVVTGAHGRYCIDLPAGQPGSGTDYIVSEVMQSGWQQTHPAAPGTYTLSLPQGTSKDGVNFGNRKVEANACVGKRPSLTQAISYTLSTNKLAVATCYADGVNDIYVMGVMDVSGHASASTHPAEYMPPMYHHPDWTRAKMGNIFGLTLDNAGNMYVTATSAYWNDVFGPAGPGGIYRVDGITGNVTTFASLPNDATARPALGNITFDPTSNRFYVSNLEDGLIYELDNSGTVLATYDHGVTGRTSATLPAIADDGTAGFTQIGRRIWGVEVHNGRLYYGVWWENFNNVSTTEANEIWSIPLSTFTTGPAQLEITMPIYQSNYSNPVADISFSPTGALLAAERGIYNDTGSMAHQARVLEFVVSGSSWVASANTFDIGDIPAAGTNPNANSAGGVDYDYAPGGWVWATGDALRFMTPAPPPETGVVYGLQGLPPTLGTIANSTITDLNGFYWQDKNEIGDVEIACPDPEAEHPDLTVSKSHLDTLIFGQSGVYSITVTNVGSGPTTGPIIVTDQLPPGITYSGVSGAGWSCVAGAVTAAGQTVTCAHSGPLAPGGSLTFNLNVTVGTPNDFPNGSQVKNCADVDTEGDLNPQNDDDCDETTVTDAPKPPDLVIDKVHIGDFHYGQSGVYSITVKNQGSGPTTGPIVVTDQLPPGVTYSGVSGAGWSCVAGPITATGQTVTCTHAGPLAAGGSLSFALTVNVGTAADIPGDIDQVRNCVEVDTEGDNKPNNNSDCDDLIVTGNQCVQPPSGMVAWWPLDEASGPIANDIANVNDGTHTNGPAPTAGKVAGALTFDGTDDYVQASDHPTLNFSASIASTTLGDFSIDAWIFHKGSNDIRMIVDKRQRQGNQLFGYSVFLRNGLLGISLADGSETVYNSGFSVTPNQWHMVAVTIDRDVSDGIRFYVDGVEVGTRGDPTVHPNTLNNGSPLRIGSSTLAVTNIFNGQIDEVEIFNRVVTPLEIASIYNAGSAGKCKDHISVPWDTPICKDQSAATIAVSVCNDDVIAHSYAMPVTGGIVGLPAGAHPSCSVNFPNPTTYTILTAQPINVPAGQCVPLSVKLDAPPTLVVNGQVACFTANVQNLDTGNVFSADSALWDHRNYCAVPVFNGNPLVGVARTPVSETLPLRFTISNTTGSAITLPWTLRIVPSDMQGENDVAGLNGMAPGQPISGTLPLPQNGKGDLDFSVLFEHFEPFRTYDVLLETDEGGSVVAAGSNGGNAPDATLILASVTVQAEPEREDSGIRLYIPVIAR